jgi:hypothetical protein
MQFWFYIKDLKTLLLFVSKQIEHNNAVTLRNLIFYRM